MSKEQEKLETQECLLADAFTHCQEWCPTCSRADGLALCQRFSCSVFFLLHSCQTALEFTVGAFRHSAAVPVAPTTTLYPRQVTEQDKKQLCCQSMSHKASSTWEENGCISGLCKFILQSY